MAVSLIQVSGTHFALSKSFFFLSCIVLIMMGKSCPFFLFYLSFPKKITEVRCMQAAWRATLPPTAKGEDQP